MNYWMCEYARQKGFKCADNFAEYMGADYDTNGDGKVDTDGLRYVPGESESSYVTRITNTLRSTIRDSNTHFVSASSSYDYIQSDDTHPTYNGGTVTAGLFGGTTGYRRSALHHHHRRQEPDLEPVWPRAHGLGCIDVQPCVTLIATEALTFGIATQAQIPAGRRAGRDTSLGPQSGPSCCCGAARGQRVGLVPVWRQFAARSDRGGSPSPAFHPLCR
jgi:hypothetical protein